MKAKRMLESIKGYVEKTDDAVIHLRIGAAVLHLLAPGYFLRRVSPGRTMEVPVYLHLQLERNRIVPLMVGFPDRRDREFFEKFISVSGVGVRAAVKALQQPPERIASAIAAEDYQYLTTLPGIGKKRARQIVAGLHGQMQKMYGDFTSSPVTEGAGAEARAVLGQLGVSAAEAQRLIDEARSELDDDADTSSIVKKAMQLRSRR